MLYKFSCPNKTAEILELEDCWTDIPIQGGGFLSPHNRLYTPHSSKVACSRFFPLTVQTTDGWVALMPHLARQPEPVHLPNEQLWKAETEDLEMASSIAPKSSRNGRERCYFPATKRPLLVRWLMETAWPLVSVRPLGLATFLCTVWLS